ncbi:Uncharacterised protein [Legionella birminghamensis]|uniref:Uncharacterized protein n=1 Tax=Legionella birminghamensis TaxID=28083 RepID=A0A378I7S7_9GAMM|nr:Uncharacterised protein [Legionella birminghamensis]
MTGTSIGGKKAAETRKRNQRSSQKKNASSNQKHK